MTVPSIIVVRHRPDRWVFIDQLVRRARECGQTLMAKGSYPRNGMPGSGDTAALVFSNADGVMARKLHEAAAA